MFKSISFNKKIVFLLSIFMFILTNSICFGATYYVDATNGNDSNDGISPSAAWKTIDRVNSSSFSPGDQILFKRGEVWEEQLTIPSSGDPGNPITFGSYGMGDKPLIIGSNSITIWQNIGSFLWASPDNTINIPGHTNDTGFLLFGEESQSNVGIRVSTGQRDLESEKQFYYDPIKDRVFIYSKSNPVNNYGNIRIACRYNGININQKSNISIENIEIKYTISSGIRIYQSKEISVHSVDLSYLGGYSFNFQGKKPMRAGNAIQIDGSSRNISISGCHTSQAFDFGITAEVNINETELLSDIVIEDNIIEKCGGGIGINSQAGSGSEVRKVYITNNTIVGSGLGWSGTNNSQHGTGINMTEITSPISDRIHEIYVEGNVIDGYAWAGIQFYQCGPVFLRQNIIRGGTGAYSEGEYKPPAGIWILGSRFQDANNAFTGIISYNLIYNNQGTGLFIINNDPIEGSDPFNTINIYNNVFFNNGDENYPNIHIINSSKNQLRNNIVYSTDSVALKMQSNTGGESDYNIFYRAQGPMIQKDTTNYTISQLSAYKSTFNQDIHSIAVDPLFIDHFNGKFQLQPESPAIDACISVGLSADFNETPVPQGNAVDIGAYEFFDAAGRISPPKNLRISNLIEDRL